VAKECLSVRTVTRLSMPETARAERQAGYAYNFVRRLKTLNGLIPYEFICKPWTSEPDRFIIDPIHQMPGLNT
jgi:hypothetical protein